MNLGLPEILLIAGVALLFFGPSKLPGLGKSIGEAIRGFKKGLDSPSEEDQERLAESQRQEAQKAQEKDKDKTHS